MSTGQDLPHLEELLAQAREGSSAAENELFARCEAVRGHRQAHVRLGRSGGL